MLTINVVFLCAVCIVWGRGELGTLSHFAGCSESASDFSNNHRRQVYIQPWVDSWSMSFNVHLCGGCMMCACDVEMYTLSSLLFFSIKKPFPFPLPPQPRLLIITSRPVNDNKAEILCIWMRCEYKFLMSLIFVIIIGGNFSFFCFSSTTKSPQFNSTCSRFFDIF